MIIEIEPTNETFDSLIQQSLLYLNEMRAMFGAPNKPVVLTQKNPLVCSPDQSAVIHSDINKSLALENIALKKMLTDVREELASCEKRNSDLRAALSRYECRMCGVK
jgi:hypothetical protein